MLRSLSSRAASLHGAGLLGSRSPWMLTRAFSDAGTSEQEGLRGSDTKHPRSSARRPQAKQHTPKFHQHEESTHFGFQEIPLDDKSSRVGDVFSSVAERYDLMNDLMSGGLHRLWKDAFVQTLAPTSEMQIVDVAGGTGDIAFRIVDNVKSQGRRLQTPVTVIDANAEMLDVGRRRAATRGYTKEITFALGDAQELIAVESESMDAYVISFGMRNVVKPELALSEALRVLKRGGRFLMLEFAKIHNPIVEQIYEAYSFNVIPSIGDAVVGDRASYQYLVESIRRFPDQEEFVEMMRDAGFDYVSHADYTFGVVAQYSGFKL